MNPINKSLNPPVISPNAELCIEQLVTQIDAILPQTQCTQCGYNGCLPYAQAIACEQAPINRCPPGGQAGLEKLAALLGREVISLNPECGQHKPLERVLIDEQHCIGCTLCIRACPVDAIVGANKFMHTVIADLCTGCALCIPPCPVDCIRILPAHREWTLQDATEARTRHQQRNKRLAILAQAEESRLNRHSVAAPALGELTVDDVFAPSLTTGMAADHTHTTTLIDIPDNEELPHSAEQTSTAAQSKAPNFALVTEMATSDSAAQARSETIAQVLARARARRQKDKQAPVMS